MTAVISSNGQSTCESISVQNNFVLNNFFFKKNDIIYKKKKQIQLNLIQIPDWQVNGSSYKPDRFITKF